MIRRLALAGAIGAVAGLLTQLPLAWAVGDRLAPADPDAKALGTVWSGHIAHIDGLPPIATTLRGTTVELAADAPRMRLAALATTNSLSDVSLSLPVASLARFDPRLDGIDGELNLQLAELTLADGQCTSASGTADTDVLAVNRSSWQWSGPRLSGPVTCEDGSVVIAMTGRDGTGSVDATFRISPSGPYRTEITLTSPDPRASTFLPLFGFQPRGADSYSISEAGRWM